jgi:hypothetical protein
LNSRAINNRLNDIHIHIFDLVNPVFIVPRHTLIDIVNREDVPFKAQFLNKRLVSFYDDITTQDTDNVGHDLPIHIITLARNDPKKV